MTYALVIKAKEEAYRIEAALAKLLAYMLDNMLVERHADLARSPTAQFWTDSSFGLIAAGGSFIFAKLDSAFSPRYGLPELWVA